MSRRSPRWRRAVCQGDLALAEALSDVLGCAAAGTGCWALRFPNPCRTSRRLCEPPSASSTQMVDCPVSDGLLVATYKSGQETRMNHHCHAAPTLLLSSTEQSPMSLRKDLAYSSKHEEALSSGTPTKRTETRWFPSSRGDGYICQGELGQARPTRL